MMRRASRLGLFSGILVVGILAACVTAEKYTPRWAIFEPAGRTMYILGEPDVGYALRVRGEDEARVPAELSAEAVAPATQPLYRLMSAKWPLLSRPHNRIHFDFDESAIRSDAVDTIAKVARIMRENPELGLVIQGHCGAIGTNAYNMELGMRRAQAVGDYLALHHGISSDRFKLLSEGEFEPLQPNSTSGPDDPGYVGSFTDNPEGRAENRRVEFFEMR